MSQVRNFGAVGDGKSDDTQAIVHALAQGDGHILFSRGIYRITRTIEVPLGQLGRCALEGSGGTAKIQMAGPGPAFRFLGTHTGNADPQNFRPEVWQNERMPVIENLEIEGGHAEADGLELTGTMQATIRGVLLRELRHGIRLHTRNRNVLISHCHIYHNTGVGIYFDHVNLHQTNVIGCHISYCRLGGIRIEGSEIRNLQITGNDIEYNNHRAFGTDPEPVADILIDCRAAGASVREGTIASNTIQATYSLGGANLRILGNSEEANHKAGMFCLVGNLIGSQENNVHLVGARGVTIEGNVVYSGHHRNLLIEECRNVVVGPNSFDHNPDYLPRELATGIRISDSANCTLTGCAIQDAAAGRHTVPNVIPLEREGLLELERCRRMTVSGCQILDGAPYGVVLRDCSDVLITGCSVLETREEKLMRAALVWRGRGERNRLAVNHLGRGVEGAALLAPEAGVTLDT